MTQPKKLLEFKKITHAYFTAYVMANAGMDSYATDIKENISYSPEGLFQIGSSDMKKEAISEMKSKDVMVAMAKNSVFSQLMAHGTLILLFEKWELVYRGKIADELGVPKGKVLCKVMGDLRHIRNWIVHKNGIPDKHVDKIEVLDFFTFGEPIMAVSELMYDIQKHLNQMTIEEIK